MQRSHLLATLVFIFSMASVAQNSGRLDALNEQYKTSALTDIQPVLSEAYTAELINPQPSLIADLQSHSSTASNITGESIANAFDLWINIVGADKESYILASDVSAHRLFLSHFAHNLIPKGKDSSVKGTLSSAEALYLLDHLISFGGCPRLTAQDRASGTYSYSTEKDPHVAKYRKALDQYYASVSETKRNANFRRVLIQAHLL